VINKDNSGFGDRLAGVFLKGAVALFFIAILYSCIDKNTRWLKPNFGEAHEYLRVTGYGPGWSSLEGNDYRYGGVGLTEFKDNFFPLGGGECESHLGRLTEKRVRLSMIAFNSFVRDEGDYNDKRVAKAKMQCVQFLGQDQACVDRLTKLSDQAEDPRVSARYFLESTYRCDQRRNIGDSRTISIRP
jgi:hypothetical protein